MKMIHVPIHELYVIMISLIAQGPYYKMMMVAGN